MSAIYKKRKSADGIGTVSLLCSLFPQQDRIEDTVFVQMNVGIVCACVINECGSSVVK